MSGIKPAATGIAAKKKLNREDFMFKDKTGEELIKKPGQVNGLDF
jgi:protein XRP2